MQNKICSRCKEEKQLICFNKSSQSPDGRQYWCKACVSKNTSVYYKQKNLNPEFRKQQSLKSAAIKRKYPSVYKNSELMRNYGINFDTFQLMLKNQNNNCAICQSELIKPNVDHCHKTGKVRKLLCKCCNTLLGQAKDNILILENAISYLKEFKDETNS